MKTYHDSQEIREAAQRLRELVQETKAANGITCAAQAVDYVRKTVKKKDADKEHYIVITLDAAYEVIKTNVITIGLINRTLVHPREIFRPAIVQSATAIIVAHTHPSGRVEPSADDNRVTKRIKDSAELLGIPLLDDLVVSTRTGAYYSNMEEHTL